jgi:hypothetical protein
VTPAIGAGALLLAALIAEEQPPPAAPAPADATAPPGAFAPPGALAPPGMTPLVPAPTPPASTGPSPPEPAGSPQKGPDVNKPIGFWQLPHYDEGFVLVSTPEESPMPYLLKLNHVSQFKYTNTLAVNHTYTTHLGEVREVQRRDDIQLTRDVFYFSGYVFTRPLDYNIIVYTSSATLSATAAGYVGYVFNKAFALRAGFFSLPSLRSMTGTYPFFPGTDRSMAVNYFRPGFTQGVWADGEVLPGVRYIAMLGNSLNTLDIAASKIDPYFAGAASVWYDWNQFGKPWNDYEYHTSPAIRTGAAFTYAREDRLSDLSTASPENNATFISDGTLLFETGTLAPGVTVQLANFYLSAEDFGIKYRGLAFNVEFYQRWLNHFTADGPLPISGMFDWGFEASLGYFTIRDVLEAYTRASFVQGPFNTAYELAVGFHWYPFKTRQVWLSAEFVGIHHSPYQSVLYIYSSGQTGFLFPGQFLLRF